MIPKSFQLAGLTITTELDPTLFRDRKIGGEALYLSQTIAIDPTAQKIESVIQCHYHERIHWILFIMGRNDLRTDEAFVDLFAHLLYQSDVTAGPHFTPEELML